MARQPSLEDGAMIIRTRLNDGTAICIRELRKNDERRLRDGFARLSSRSRYLRFFSGMREPTQPVVDALLDVDGHDHLAWGAIATEEAGEPAIGVVHAFRDEAEASAAEFSVAVIDEYHGRGLASILTAVLLLDCRQEGLEALDVQVLSENEAALKLTRLLGGKVTALDRGVEHLRIDVGAALATLENQRDIPGMADVFQQWEAHYAAR